jgi:hypothetical protein
MNKRIQELALLAKEIATTRDVSGKLVLSISSDTFEEKFAELIVKECVEYYRSKIGETSEPHTKTLEHFGVE